MIVKNYAQSYSSLTSGTVGVSYGTNLSATGGETPYTWAIISGSLPPGLTLSTSGLISGTPTTAGTYSFTVQVRDSSSPQQSASKPLSIVVNPSTTSGILQVTPSDGLISSGPQGGPFTPSSKTYTLTNTGGSSINWTASKGQSWVSLSSTGSTLAAGGSTTITVPINSSANSLASNNYSDIIYFTNTTNGNGNTTRSVNLTVTGSTITPPAEIVSYSPSSKITVNKGQSFTISVSFKNTGNSGANFYGGVTIWDSNGNPVFDSFSSSKIYLGVGQQGSASWAPTINTVGEYWLQFGVWDEAKSKLLDKEPSPSQNLIKVL